jgi:hypothetical protein
MSPITQQFFPDSYQVNHPHHRYILKELQIIFQINRNHPPKQNDKISNVIDYALILMKVHHQATQINYSNFHTNQTTLRIDRI